MNDIRAGVLLIVPGLVVLTNLVLIEVVRTPTPAPIVWACVPSVAVFYILGISSWRLLKRHPSLGLSLCLWTMLLTLPGQLVSEERAIRIIAFLATLVLPGIFGVAFALRCLWSPSTRR